MSKRNNPLIVRLFILALLLALMSLYSPARAETSELFFSEYIEGSSYSKALEIFNGTGAPVDLAAGGYNIEIYFNGSTSAGVTIGLTGTVADGDVYVVADDGAVGAVLAETDQTSTSNFFNGDDAVVLSKGGVIIDVIGQIGVDPGSEWGSGDTSTENNTLRRMSSVVAGDTDGSDAFDPALEWVGYSQDTFDGLGSHTIDNGGGAAEPVINEFVASHTGTDAYEYIEIYGDPDTDYSGYTLLQLEGDSGSNTGTIDTVLSAGTTDANGFWVSNFFTNEFENGTITLLLVSGFTGTDGMDLDTDDNGTLDTIPWTAIVDGVAIFDGDGGDQTYTATVLEEYYDGLSYPPGGASRYPDGSSTWVRNDFDLAGIPGFTGTIADGEAYNTPGAANQIYVPPPEGCDDEYTAIYNIQGDGLYSPLDGNEVSTEGVVVGDFQNGLNGFYLQDVNGDGNPTTSDGIFVYYTGADVNVGDTVRVHGYVDEYYSLTEITGVSQLWSCGTAELPEPAEITLPVASVNDFEAYEGMYVTFPQALYISEYYNYDRYGEIVFTEERQFQPTAIYDPYTAEAEALALYNTLSRITLDDGRSWQNPDPAIHPNGDEFTLENLFRGGDQVANLTGTLDYNHGLYKLQPTQGGDYTPMNPRPEAHEDVGSGLKVASFNVLNYFTTLGSRGADTELEFERQRNKIFAALADIDADVVGLIEIENNGTAVQDLVMGLNEYLGADVYAYIDTGVIGFDEITVAYIYKPAAVTLVGAHAVLDDPSFTNPLGYVDEDGNPDYKTRPALAQTFMDNQTGGIFTAVVNHLKSKGSDCEDDDEVPEQIDDDPVQGNCNLTRTMGAQALVDWLATDPTGSNDTDFLIMGDLNAYDKEDPIDVLLASGYSDLILNYQGEYAYSYVFDGQLGYLDHGLANSGLNPEITGATIWHINADEPDLIDYDMTYKRDAQDALYEPNAYRSSDHDPVIVGMDLFAPSVDVWLNKDTLWPVDHKMVTVRAQVDVSGDNHPTVTLVSITSNEPEEGPGNNSDVDIEIINDLTFKLRAERLGTGDDRVYTITWLVSSNGESTLVTATVTVPHNQ